ncbi:MAG: SDR family oxidoreductase [Bacteroidota bacterium]
MNEFNLHGKTILITGASSGIGRTSALEASRNGASLIITGRDEKRLEETYSGLEKGNHSMYKADLTREDELDALVSSLPKLNGIVHCAGIVGPLPVKFITQADIDRMFSINYVVPVNLTSKLLRKKLLQNPSSIVFMSSIATRNPYFGGALYSGSKAALEAYSKTLALEFVTNGIRSNCLLAGLVETPMIDNHAEKKMQDEALNRYLGRYPMGIGKPGDVAAAVIYFLSDASKWVNGTSLILGGE